MRVYVPVTPELVRTLLETGALEPPVQGFAVTGAVREWYATGDEEELEYVAMTHAARASLALLAAVPAGGGDRGGVPAPQRMVLAVDTDDVRPEPDGNRGEVVLDAALTRTQVAALHADTDEAADDVAAAVAVLRAGGPHDADEEFVVDGCEGHELAWFAAQEIADRI